MNRNLVKFRIHLYRFKIQRVVLDNIQYLDESKFSTGQDSTFDRSRLYRSRTLLLSIDVN